MEGVWLFLRTLGALAVVVAAIVWAARALGRLPAQRERGRMEILGALPLGGRRSLALVRVGRRALVVGVGEREVACLYAIEDPEEVAELAGERWMSLDEAARAEPAAPLWDWAALRARLRRGGGGRP
ncbi:MAG: flagellar biosynthetic protein FliO [Firmicutes bacterium]|nr:flagellar biosynthetic protein FliO [Bacillota bacterium]